MEKETIIDRYPWELQKAFFLWGRPLQDISTQRSIVVKAKDPGTGLMSRIP